MASATPSSGTRQRKQNLPSASKQDKHITRSIKPPLHNLNLNSFIYILVFISVLLAGYYSWKIVQLEREVGGWWNLAVGKRPPQLNNQYTTPVTEPSSGAGQNEVEQKINELAKALGMKSKDLASAIADAVRDHVPPASLSSIASKETGSVIQHLVGKQEQQGGGGVAESVGHVVGSVVGLDDVPEGI